MSQEKSSRSISLSSTRTPYTADGRFLVIPRDVEKDFETCAALVQSHSGTGAWLVPESSEMEIPPYSELLLVEFQKEYVLTHRVTQLNRRGREVLVSIPRETEKEESLLAPSTGRYDYRVRVNLPVRVKTGWVEPKGAFPKMARLTNLSRGGMSILAPVEQEYEEGQEITVRVVGWERPVRIDAVIGRIETLEDGKKQRLALKFPADMEMSQREMVSSFIIQVQRRAALGRALPISEE